MALTSLLVANRGEIAIRVIRAATDLGIRTVSVHAADDADSLHTRHADVAVALPGSGAAAYLDIEAILAVATEADCDALHPGYGFLSENPALARRCEQAGIAFVGPSSSTLELFGDKVRGRSLASNCDVPVLEGSDGPATPDDAHSLLDALGPGAAVMLKAAAGGGGRGMRVVRDAADVEEAFARCRSEARRAFGDDTVFVERYLAPARHIEVQIVGDGSGSVVDLGERDCSIQRRHQKLVEIAPSPGLRPGTRKRVVDAAVRLAKETSFANVGTFEFLVAADSGDEVLAFIEANPRLQVEHTVTEEVTGVDLVRTQLQLAAGATLAELGLDPADRPVVRGTAIQVRVNAELISPDGVTTPTSGTLTALELPAGPGVRVDTAAYRGYEVNPRFDSLVAKVVAHAPHGGFGEAVTRTYRALSEFRIDGVGTNVGFLQNLLCHREFVAGELTVGFVEDHLEQLTAVDVEHPRRYVASEEAVQRSPAGIGARLESTDPLAVLEHGRSRSELDQGVRDVRGPGGTTPIVAPVQGTIVEVAVDVGDEIQRGHTLVVMEAMKMEHVVTADVGGVVRQVEAEVGRTLAQGDPLVFVEASQDEADAADDHVEIDLEATRPDLDEVLERHRMVTDEARPDAVERRRKTKQRTARENIDDLCDPGSFMEYGPLVIAAQRQRRSLQNLIEKTPADGLVTGIGTVNGDLFDEERARAVVLSYDYTVLAGTQGKQNHDKKDRMFELAAQWELPVVFFTEGGGGRPGDTDVASVAGLDVMAFHLFGRLSGNVPLVGITSGRCFAGNAALLGCCDVIIATEGSNIGMGGPAMIEGGGLGAFRPEEVGPLSVQRVNGVVDIPVANEAEAVQVARQYLSYFQGPVNEWKGSDQRRLRHVVPENRLRVYDVRTVIETMADEGSVLELRREFGVGMVTALVRVEGEPVGVIANDPTHLGGAIDRDAADKGARFMQLCDAFGLPIVSLCDTPGFMVGPESEKTATVRHFGRMFVTGANLRVPVMTFVLRKAYGLGAQAMVGGSFKAPVFTLAWPTGEFGGMGLEGAVKLGYRKELEAIEDPEERLAHYEEMVEQMYRRGKAVNASTFFEFDDVIDPFDTRRWILAGIRSAGAVGAGRERGRRFVDTW